MYQNGSERHLTVFYIDRTTNVCYDFVQIWRGDEIAKLHCHWLKYMLYRRVPEENQMVLTLAIHPKGQTISKANYGVLNSPKKRTLG